MIETAAAAPMAADWAQQAAFFALGTNDLTASALGLDRDDPAAAAQMDPLHPGLLRLLDGVVDGGARGGPAGVGVRRDGGRPARGDGAGGAGRGLR